jgi:hypothetical protein
MVTWTDVVTAFVAVAALALSIYNFRVNRKDKQPSLEIRLSVGTHEALYWTDLHLDKEAIHQAFFIEVTNTGQVPAPLTTLGFEGKLKTDLDRSIEATVNPHSPSFILERDYETFLKATGEATQKGKGWIRAIISVPTGKKFYSNKLKVTQDN